MRTAFRSLALFALVAGVLASAGLSDAPARQKEKDKGEKAAEDAVGTVEVYQTKDGWRFRVKSAEGKLLAVGAAPFEKKDEALKAVEALKAGLGKAKVVEIKDEKGKKKDDKK